MRTAPSPGVLAGEEVTVGGPAVFPFRARWIAAGLAAGLSLEEVKGMHFALLLQICAVHAQAQGAKLVWANLVPSERETLRGALDRLISPAWPPVDSKSKLDWIPPPPNGVWPLLEDPPKV